MSQPLMTLTSAPGAGAPPSSVTIRLVEFRNRVHWSVAPRNESSYAQRSSASSRCRARCGHTREPKPPARVPHSAREDRMPTHCARQAVLCQMSEAAIVRPMSRPPPRDDKVPTTDMPPFVPGGTGLREVMRIGRERERIPSSEASVSPRQHAKCL